jgi:hypothetical protein
MSGLKMSSHDGSTPSSDPSTAQSFHMMVVVLF